MAAVGCVMGGAVGTGTAQAKLCPDYMPDLSTQCAEWKSKQVADMYDGFERASDSFDPWAVTPFGAIEEQLALAGIHLDDTVWGAKDDIGGYSTRGQRYNVCHYPHHRDHHHRGRDGYLYHSYHYSWGGRYFWTRQNTNDIDFYTSSDC